MRLSALGDVIQSLPILAFLKASWPGVTIGWVVEADAADLLKGNPLIDHLHVSHRKRWLKQMGNPSEWGVLCREVREFRRTIQSVEYEMVLDLQGLLKSSLTAWLTGIKRRIGFACAREMAPLLYTQKVHLSSRMKFSDPTIPISQHFVTMAEAIGCSSLEPEYPLSPVEQAERQSVEDLLKGIQRGKPTVLFAPSTQWKSKHWPTTYWTDLAQRLLGSTECNIVLIGGKGDAGLSQSILAPITSEQMADRVLDLTGKTTLKMLQALIESVDVVVGLDSAPLHLAGAVGKPRLVGIYGPTAYRRTPPPGRDNQVLLSTEGALACQPCDQTVCPLQTLECMHRITPENVFEKVVEQLDAAKSLSP